MYTIRLKHNSNSIVIKRAGVGPTGPQGPQGEPGEVAVESVNGQIGTVVLDQDDVLDGVNYKQYSSIEKTKLASVTNGATPNNISDTDATDLTDGGDSTLHFHSSDRNRANHTGTQLASTVSDFSTAADARIAAATSTGTGSIVRSSSPLITTPTGIVKGDIGLGSVDNTSDATKNSAVATLTNKTLTSPVINTPTGITKTDVGLGNVDNTSDANKPVSTAQTTALNLKANLAGPTFTGVPTAPTAAVGTNTTQVATTAYVVAERGATATLTNKTLTSPSITTPTGIVKGDVGLGNVDNTSDATKNSAVATLTNKTLTSPSITTPTGIVKGDVGLGNVDNTSDATKNSATATLTNKRITKRVSSNTSSATPTPNADTDDVYLLTAQAATAAFAVPSGTPTAAQPLVIRIKDDGTARTISWNAIYRAIGVTLPTTTVISKTLYIGFMYNSVDIKWDCLAVSLEA
jgi:hypothetical protein